MRKQDVDWLLQYFLASAARQCLTRPMQELQVCAGAIDMLFILLKSSFFYSILNFGLYADLAVKLEGILIRIAGITTSGALI